jgi:hypothetical protein
MITSLDCAVNGLFLRFGHKCARVTASGCLRRRKPRKPAKFRLILAPVARSFDPVCCRTYVYDRSQVFPNLWLDSSVFAATSINWPISLDEDHQFVVRGLQRNHSSYRLSGEKARAETRNPKSRKGLTDVLYVCSSWCSYRVVTTVRCEVAPEEIAQVETSWLHVLSRVLETRRASTGDAIRLIQLPAEEGAIKVRLLAGFIHRQPFCV